MPYERLSAQDATFLHLETDTSPMHVGSVTLFEAGPFLDDDGRFRIDDVRRLIESRLDRVPRYRQRLLEVPFGQGRPVWVDDEDFDLAYHVRLTAVPRPGTEEQLRALAGRIQAQPLDRRRPLWEFWWVEGVEGDRVALIHKTHHAMVDGVASVDVATVLFDLEPTDPPSAEEVHHWEPAPAPTPAQLLTETLVERATQPAEMLRSFRAAMRGPTAMVDGAKEVSRALRTAAAGDAPQMPFNQPIGPHRRFEVARVPLEPVKDVRRAHATTVNDVVLAIVTGALRTYLDHADVDVDRLTLRALVPVNVRAEAERGNLGNRVAAIVVDLPVGEADPVQRLLAINGQTTELKQSGDAEAVERLTAMLDFAPPPLLDLGARLVARQRAVNLVVTNVPGPPVPLYCMGAKLLEPFPYVGIADTMALAVAVVSYEGQLCFGLTGDRDLLPDLAVLAEAIEKSATELVELS